MKKVIPIAMLALFQMSGLAFAGNTGKIAVTATDKTPGAAVSNMPAFAPYFFIFDANGKLLETVDNHYAKEKEPGPDVMKYLARKGVTVVVAGFFMPKVLEDYMKPKGLRPFTFTGTAQDAVKKVLESK